MNIILKNFISMLSRYKQACLLNILGLSVAFAAAFIIIVQLKYEWGYDKFYKKADCIYRLELKFQDNNSPIVSRPLGDLLIQASHHIKEAALVQGASNLFFSLTSEEGDMYEESYRSIYPSFTHIFDFQVEEGSLDCLKDVRRIIIPKSLAEKLFGRSSAINQVLYVRNKSYDTEQLVVGGVYRDFPRNSSVKNDIYIGMSEDDNNKAWGDFENRLILLLDASESKRQTEESLKAQLVLERDNIPSYLQDIKEIELNLLSEVYSMPITKNDAGDKGSTTNMNMLMVLAVLLLLIAGINFTNFSTALTPLRIRRINTQKVLGSSDILLRLTLLVEAILISFIAYLLSLGMVYAFSISGFSGLLLADLSLLANIDVLLLMAVLSIIIGLFAGIYPAYYITSFSPALVLKGSFGLSAQGRLLRNILIGIQFTAALALIVIGLFVYLQNHFMKNSPLGFDKEQVLTVEMSTKLKESRGVFIDIIKEMPAFSNIAFADCLPASSDFYRGLGRSYEGKSIGFLCLSVSPSFLEVLGIPVVDGRNFREADEESPDGAYIFNEKAKNAYDMKLGTNIDGSEIVGFVSDLKVCSFRLEVSPMAFYVLGAGKQGNRYNVVLIKVKAGANLKESMKSTYKALAEIDPYYPFRVHFYDEVLDKLYEKEERASTLINLLSLLAVFLAIVGVFGLVVFESQYRKKEIAIRKVHGGTVGGLLLRFNRAYLYILLVGFVIAAPLAYYGASSWLANFAYRIPLYWWVFVLAFVIILLITSITVSLQSWKAANQNPAEIVNRE